MQENNLDTKSQLFNTALRLFAVNGYENVSVRQIADAVGIKAGSIYNHFSTKEEMLDSCYEYWIKNRHKNRLDKKHYEPIIKNGTKEEVLNVLLYQFPQSIGENMIFCLIIIFSRIHSDSKAKNIYIDEIDTSMRYMADFFNSGIKAGRFQEFNFRVISWILLSSRLFLAQVTTISPEKINHWGKVQTDTFTELLKLIPFKY